MNINQPTTYQLLPPCTSCYLGTHNFQGIVIPDVIEEYLHEKGMLDLLENKNATAVDEMRKAALNAIGYNSAYGEAYKSDVAVKRFIEILDQYQSQAS